MGNEYTKYLGKFYTKTPKAVFAAIALSLAVYVANEGEANDLKEGKKRMLEEWQILFDAEILKQEAR